MFVFRISKVITAMLLLSSCIYTLKSQAHELKTHAQQATQPLFANTMIEMTNIPAGSFWIDHNPFVLDEASRQRNDAFALALRKTEITFTQWDTCVKSGAYSHRPYNHDWERDNRSFINVSYQDITQEFISWLSKVNSINYRLPTNAESQYVAIARSIIILPNSDEPKYSQAHYKNQNNYACQEEIEPYTVVSYQSNWTDKKQRSQLISFRLAHNTISESSLEVGQTLEFLLASEGDPDEISQELPDGEHFNSYYYHQSNTSYIINTETGYICAITTGKHNGTCTPSSND